GGVAYVSYNTPSGWAVRGELRRLLLSVAAGAGGPRELLHAARSTLDRLASAAPPPESFYESVWQHELALARAKSDHDLVQDLLAEHNQPLDVRDVVRMGRARGLEYLDELAPAMADARKELAIRAGLARSGDDP